MTNVKESDLPETLQALEELNKNLCSVNKAFLSKNKALQTSLIRVDEIIAKINKVL